MVWGFLEQVNEGNLPQVQALMARKINKIKLLLQFENKKIEWNVQLLNASV